MKDIRPIRTEADYEWAVAEVTKYFDKQPEVGSPDGDRFDVLATLIEAYEDRYYPITAPDPVSAIQAYMDMSDLKQSALATILGSRPRASEVLGRKRALTVEMIYKLTREWPIPAEVLVQPYHLQADMAE
ncbi:MAG TPA: XRE family transcriptional regulator [Parvibaculum sp.]|jgi:HTH-type transcriptional regulator/antitoxin HigA